MWVDDTERPNFWDGQYLGPSDFVSTVEYGREARRRLSLGQHAWGIFRGLDIVEQARAGSTTEVDLFISPGLAVDGFGRELIVYHPLALSPELFQRYASEKWVKVWLRYDTELVNPPSSGFETCDDPNAAYRTLETVKIELGAAGEISRVHDPIQVDGKAIVESDYPDELSIPFQALPDDDELTSSWWLVPIGYVHWDGTGGFTTAKGTPDEAKVIKDRVYGGDVSAHTYAPDGHWDVVAGLPDVSTGVRPIVHATVRGRLTVQNRLVAKRRVRLDGGTLSFALPNGDETIPLDFKRLGLPTDPGATLRLQLGNASKGDSRFVIRSQGTVDRFSIDDGGDGVVGHDLVVRNALTTQKGDKDTYVLKGSADAFGATALGLEAGGDVVYARARDGLRVYLDQPVADKDHQVFAADANGLSVRRNIIAGWGSDGHVQTRHVIGKGSGNDSIDTLYLNWRNGHDVWVGEVGGTTSDLYVSGTLYIGPNKVPLETPIDVKVGRLSSLLPSYFPVGNWNDPSIRTIAPFGVTTFKIKSALTNAVQTPQIIVSLSDVFNNDVAEWPRWAVSAAPIAKVDDQTWEFELAWWVQDDSVIYDATYTAVFYP